jgi:hypothetical protein
VPGDWTGYDYLEFDVFPEETTMQGLMIYTNFGLGESLGMYSNGTLPGVWHHVKIDLRSYSHSVSTFIIMVHSNSLEKPSHDYVFYLDNIVLTKAQYAASATLESRPVQLSGVHAYGSMVWAPQSDARFYTSTSADGTSWSPWQEVSHMSNDTGNIQSPANQYIRYRASLSSDGSTQKTLSEIRINYNGADPCAGRSDGQTCYDGFVCCGGSCIFGDCCSQTQCESGKSCTSHFCADIPKVQCSAADTQTPIGTITNSELAAFISIWRSGNAGLLQLLDAINKWKNGCQ